ncbi:MAG: hypothetical protein HY067_21605 [Betaproteobacteria bacterium]|nr:hypothetical protein [Betaproteobacteria bacterium]
MLLLVRGVAAAEVSGHVALLSDYRYRGESLTDGQPALQAAVNYDHSSGLFLGALASTVRIDPADSGLGAQLYAGYARSFNEKASWEIGVVTYLLPDSPMGRGYDYTEGFVGASYDTVNARLYYSDDYFGAGGKTVYLEVNASRPLNERVALTGHLGYLDHRQTRQPLAGGQDHSQLDFKAGIAIDVTGFTLELSIVGTTAQHDPCPAGTGHCNTTGLVSISRRF